MENKNVLFLSARISKNGEIEDTIETSICLFVYTYCNFNLNICFVDDADEYACKVSKLILKHIKYECYTGNEIDLKELCLVLPAVKTDGGQTFIAGVCAVLRWAIKSHLVRYPGHFSKDLLGFRGGCLVACADSSLITKFCELQMPSAVSEIKSMKCATYEKSQTVIPSSLVLLDAHLRRPVRTHNILKRKIDAAKKVKKNNSNSVVVNSENESSTTPSTDIEFTIYDKNSLPLCRKDISKVLQEMVLSENSLEFSLDHNYLEGIDFTLADMIVFPCVHYIFKNLPFTSASLLDYVVQWYERLLRNEQVKAAAETCGFSLNSIFKDSNGIDDESVAVNELDVDSLYKRDPSHTKMKIKHKDPCEILTLLEKASIHPLYATDYCTTLDWENISPVLHPTNGYLPERRIARKTQQIESIVTAILKVAIDGQTIVEFCAGGGP